MARGLHPSSKNAKRPYVEWAGTRDVDGTPWPCLYRTAQENAIKRAQEAARTAGRQKFKNDGLALQWFIEWKKGRLVT